MKNRTNLAVRAAFYIAGFLIMTLGIAISVKSDMGVSPVSSIPYTMTCIWGIEMGRATVLFHTALVFIQLLLLRKEFKPINLLQIPVGILFGAFTSFSNGLMLYFPAPQNLTVQLLMMLCSTALIAFGVFLYVPANFIPLAGEGAILAVSKVTKIKFSTAKLVFDITMVAVSLLTCLIIIRRPGSVGLGTVAAAVLVGLELKVITRFWGERRDMLLKAGTDAQSAG